MWKPRPPVAPPPAADGAPGGSDDPLPPATVPTPAPLELPKEPPKKQRKVSLSGLLGKAKKETTEEETAAPALDELEQYLAEPAEDDMDVDVLSSGRPRRPSGRRCATWSSSTWRRRPRRPVWSASSRPPARCTATSRSPRRTAHSIEHSLFAAFNTD